MQIDSKQTNPSETNHLSQIYTFREQNKNEEYFKNSKVERVENLNNESDFVTGYFSPEEISIDKNQNDSQNEIVVKKIFVQKNLNLKGSFQKGKFVKMKKDSSISPREIKNIKALGKENKPYNTTTDEHSTLNINDKRHKGEKLGNYEDKNMMRRSNPVGSFQKEADWKDSFKEANSKTTQNESTISESSNTHLSKSEVNFYKSGSKKRLKSRRKNSKPKLDCKSTREAEDKSQNLGIYGSILENTRNKRKSVSRPSEKDSVAYYKDKYSRMKRMYEYEKTNKTNELEQIAQENAMLKRKFSILKQDHKDEINKLKQELEDAFNKIDYYEDVIRGRSRIDSMNDEISRSCTESKTGESTLESDKLANLLKNKEDNIKRLMQELKHSNFKVDESKN